MLNQVGTLFQSVRLLISCALDNDKSDASETHPYLK